MQFTRRKRTISEHKFSKFRQNFMLLPKFCVSVPNKDKIIRTIHRCTTYQRFVDKTQPLHASQPQDPSDPTLFTLRCYPTDDLMYAILSHGRKLSVLAPEDFKRRIMEEVEGMKEGYEG